jgi:hypothetical protein
VRYRLKIISSLSQSYRIIVVRREIVFSYSLYPLESVVLAFKKYIIESVVLAQVHKNLLCHSFSEQRWVLWLQESSAQRAARDSCAVPAVRLRPWDGGLWRGRPCGGRQARRLASSAISCNCLAGPVASCAAIPV